MSDRRAFRVDPRLLALAKEMRHEAVPAERKLWACLRNRRLNDFKFRRQFPVDEFIADFCCPECRLIVEADGESHEDRVEDDAARSEHLEAIGYSVVRFTNVDVHENLDGVLTAILDACESRRNSTLGPSPLPSPPSTGERG